MFKFAVAVRLTGLIEALCKKYTTIKKWQGKEGG